MKNSNYPVKIEMSLVWGDLDPHYHLNNVNYFRFFEAVRVIYFEKIGLLEMQRMEGIGSILKETSCSFVKSVTYPDTVTVKARCSGIRTSSFSMEFVLSGQDGETAALGTSVTVIFDYNSKSKHPMPESIRAAIEKLENKKFS